MKVGQYVTDSVHATLSSADGGALSYLEWPKLELDCLSIRAVGTQIAERLHRLLTLGQQIFGCEVEQISARKDVLPE